MATRCGELRVHILRVGECVDVDVDNVADDRALNRSKPSSSVFNTHRDKMSCVNNSSL